MRLMMLYPLFICVGVYLLLTGTADAQIYDNIFVQQGSGDIYNINDASGATTLLSSPGHNWNGAAYDATNHLIYLDDIGQATFALGDVVNNKIYTFNPSTLTLSASPVATINGAVFSGAGFHNGLYYTLGTGANTLKAYDVTGLVTGTTGSLVSTQTLGGLGAGITGLSLGDIDFIGNSIYISGGKVSGGVADTNYTLLKYTNVSSLTTPAFSVSEGLSGVGIAEDPNIGKLVLISSTGEIDYVDPTTGAIAFQANMTGSLTSPGAGDFTIITNPTPVPEPAGIYGGGMVIVLALAAYCVRRRRDGLAMAGCLT